MNLRGVFSAARSPAVMRDGLRPDRNLSSLAGQAGSLVNGAHYAASKAGSSR